MGYETELFVNQPVDANLVCNICHSVQEKPTVVCKNGHTFCSTCIRTWEKESNECPDCRSTIRNKVMCLPVQNLIMALQVRCPETMEKKEAVSSGPQTRARKRAREEEGNDTAVVVSKTTTVHCDWTGTLSEYLERHQKRECCLRQVKCPLGCREMIRACDLDVHKETECTRRRVTCDLCQQSVYVRRLQQHQKNTCPEALASCQFCGEEMLRKLLGKRPGVSGHDDLPQGQTSKDDRYTKHYKICPKLKVTCEFYDHGCQELIAREDLDDHHVAFARKHATLVSDKMKQNENDKAWSEENMSWEIPTSVLLQAHRTLSNGEFHTESQRVNVGDYKAFLRLTIFDDASVFVSVCVERHMFAPSIDQLEISCDEGLLDMTEVQDMDEDDNDTWSMGDVLKYSTDDGNQNVTLDNLLDWAADNDDKCIVYAKFRLSGPEDADYRCVGCQPRRSS